MWRKHRKGRWIPPGMVDVGFYAARRYEERFGKPLDVAGHVRLSEKARKADRVLRQDSNGIFVVVEFGDDLVPLVFNEKTDKIVTT